MNIRKTIEDLVQIRAEELRPELSIADIFNAIDYLDCNTKQPENYDPKFNHISTIKTHMEKAALWFLLLYRNEKITHFQKATGQYGLKTESDAAISNTFELQAELEGMLYLNTMGCRKTLDRIIGSNDSIRELAYEMLIASIEQSRKESDPAQLKQAISLLFFIFAEEGKNQINSLILDFLL